MSLAGAVVPNGSRLRNPRQTGDVTQDCAGLLRNLQFEHRYLASGKLLSLRPAPNNARREQPIGTAEGIDQGVGKEFAFVDPPNACNLFVIHVGGRRRPTAQEHVARSDTLCAQWPLQPQDAHPSKSECPMSVLLRIRAIGAVANDELRGELLSPLLVVQKKILEPGAEWAFGVNGTAAGAALCRAA